MQLTSPRWRLLPAATLALVAGCVPTGNAPSLAQRPFERGDATPAPSPPPPAAVAAADPTLLAHLADLERTSTATDAAFTRALPAVQHAVLVAGPAGSESWISAQQLVSSLDSAREPDTAALAELGDTARTLEASPAASATASMGAVAAAVAAIQARDDGHRAQVEALVRRLPS